MINLFTLKEEPRTTKKKIFKADQEDHKLPALTSGSPK